MYCPQCSTEIPDDAKFCYKCRYDLARLKTPPARKASSDPLDDIETTLGQEIYDDSFTKGSLFANRYEILDEGKKGGMGAVYKCTDTKLRHIIALKVIHPRLLSSKQAVLRFRQEVAISMKLQHTNIVRVYNLEEYEDKEYFTMEWVDGTTLREIINQRKKENRPFSLQKAYTIISQLSDALQYAHQFTIHRDIKPENILVQDAGSRMPDSGFQLKLTDFGIAKMLSPSQLTTTAIRMGTPDYMAPEQKLDAGQADKRADIYAMGIVLFELLTLADPAAKETASELNPDIPKSMDALIKKAVALRSESRYREAAELSDALKKVITGTSDQAEKERKEAEQKRIEEEQKSQAEERKRKDEAERQKIEQQKKQQEEKQKKEEDDRKSKEAERLKAEEEKKKIDEKKRQEEQVRREDAERLSQGAGGITKKSKKVMIGIAAAIAVLVLIVYMKSQQGNPPEQPVPASILAEAPVSAPVPAPVPQVQVQPVPVPIPAPVPKAEEKKTVEDPSPRIAMVSVKGGCYQMGDTFGDGDADEKPVHEVCMDNFYIGKYEVTQGQWNEVMGNNPSKFSSCGDNCPVEQVSWNDAQEFIKKLNQKTGKRYRLPTEAEWEYAARSGGKSEKYSGGNNADSVAWYSSISGIKTHPVGQKRANGLGIYDMSGNVWEWCQDWYSNYGSGSQNNPTGTVSGSSRVVRGGSWVNLTGDGRAANRLESDPGHRHFTLGFRLARTH